MKEAVFHESRKVSEVGSAREEGRVLKQNEKGVASLHKSNLGTRVSGAGRARARPIQPIITLAPHLARHAKNQD
jgi:hypothetical protein